MHGVAREPYSNILSPWIHIPTIKCAMLFYFAFSIYYNLLFLKPYIFTGASTIEDCEAQIAELELVLDAKVLSLLQPKFP